jgi:hypothetical protein
MLRLAEQAGVSKQEFSGIIDQVRAAVAGWTRFAAEAGASASSIRQIAQSLRTTSGR